MTSGAEQQPRHEFENRLNPATLAVNKQLNTNATHYAITDPNTISEVYQNNILLIAYVCTFTLTLCSTPHAISYTISSLLITPV